MTISLLRRALTGLALVGAVLPAAQPMQRAVHASPPPALTITGSGVWAPRPHGDVVVNGDGQVTWRSRAVQTVTVAAVIGPDDRTLPAPGECEPAVSTITIDGRGRLDVTLIGDGEVCGQYPQPPTSIVSHVFTGRYEVLDTSRRNLAGTDGFFEIRLASDGTASVFAVDT